MQKSTILQSSADIERLWLCGFELQNLRNVLSINIKSDVRKLIVILANLQRINTYPISVNEDSSVPFELIHRDVRCAPVSYIDGYQYCVSFIDDATKCTWIYAMKSHDALLVMFENFHKTVSTKFDEKSQEY